MTEPKPNSMAECLGADCSSIDAAVFARSVDDTEIDMNKYNQAISNLAELSTRTGLANDNSDYPLANTSQSQSQSPKLSRDLSEVTADLDSRPRRQNHHSGEVIDVLDAWSNE